jgi:uncharacterized membrane protein (UPF0127 family)
MRAWNATRGTVLAEHVTIAQTFWHRLKGLLGTRGLSEGEGLLLVPCSSVHSLGMAFDVDVVHMSPEGTVLCAFTLRRGRIGPAVRGSRAALELPEGTIARTATQVGDQLKLVDVG